MAKILVYNQDTNRMETCYRDESDSMPYNTNRTLRVREFRGSSKSNILWTDKRTMQAWNSQRYIYGAPIYVGFSFKRPYEGGHGNQSQHYAVTAFVFIGISMPILSRLGKNDKAAVRGRRGNRRYMVFWLTTGGEVLQ